MAENFEGDEVADWDAVAHKHWPPGPKGSVKVKSKVIEQEIWKRLEQKDFDLQSLLTLEGLQLLERQASRNCN